MIEFQLALFKSLKNSELLVNAYEYRFAKRIYSSICALKTVSAPFMSSAVHISLQRARRTQREG